MLYVGTYLAAISCSPFLRGVWYFLAKENSAVSYQKQVNLTIFPDQKQGKLTRRFVYLTTAEQQPLITA